MIQTRDLQVLSGWCRRHSMSWLPGRADDGVGGLLLLASCGTASEEFLLLLGAPEMRLIDEAGNVMASASDLPALLDALDGGVTPQ